MTLPTVSIIVPAANAADTIGSALHAIEAQDYPNIVDVVVAAADVTTAEAARRHGAIVVDNPAGLTPSGLNLAIEASGGDVLVRVDAHSTIPNDYVTTAVKTLQETNADNVGGMQIPVGTTFWSRAIAAAMASPIGSGDARYRIGGEAGPVDTVYLGAFKRSTLQTLGGYDEAYSRHQDYELNERIRRSGGIVWFNPNLRVEYQPRSSPRALSRQYFQYGSWKRSFARANPGSLRLRQIAPPTLVVALAVSLVASMVTPWFLVVPSAYLAGIVMAGILAVGRAGLAAIGVPMALATMHISWGLGFLLGQSKDR